MSKQINEQSEPAGSETLAELAIRAEEVLDDLSEVMLLISQILREGHYGEPHE